MVEIEGTVEHIVFRNEENGYTVAKIKYNKDLISVVGYMPFLNEGQRVKIQGEWTLHQTFGQQIKVESCEEIMPATVEGVEKYLASGLIPGIGPVTARKIVEKFGVDALDIMEMNPERLTEVEGIGEKKAAKIAEAFQEQRELRQVMVFLQSYGITATYAIKIYKKYGQNTIKTVKENPYRLCDDISGIGFKTADKIARNLGVDPSSLSRVMAGIKYVLNLSTSNGHVYLPRLMLLDECARLLNVPPDLVEDALISLSASKQVVIEQVDGEQVVYLNSFYYSELGVAKRLIELSLQKVRENFDTIEEEIKEYEDENDITFAEEQKLAIMEGVKNGVCVITGGPGTGKTTIIKCIIKIFEKRGMHIVLAAPTGRAAKRITETTGYEAKTIHRLLEMEFMPDEHGNVFAKDEGDPIETDVIIIDEASMVDILLMNSLLKAVAPSTRLIIVGDVDQLPSVGPGNVLRDIIESRAISVVRLNRIFRQSDESLITLNAHKINNGEMPILNDREKDFFFIQKNNPQLIVEEILELVSRRLPAFKNRFDPMKDIQVLSPMRKGETGIYNLNVRLQNILNPPSQDKKEKSFRDYVFREGDKVMQIKNNYNIEWTSVDGLEVVKGTGVYNGDIGYIDEIDEENQTVTVIFDDKKVVYDFTSLDELELAYGITIHKSQGSEFPVVVIPVTYGPPMLMARNLIYTGVTRAKKLVILVGMRQALLNMINNNTIIQRYSGLRERITSYVNLISASQREMGD
ncbi:ATP-dependent RecD-like DNA helicase [Fonticella tunisiensis]|uniref:ATP-dependent RecD2 DNA helicase n=1 Tax=Fonticella tunisiensis TaxID=1096341 RepID=A0A4R7KS70_9CLOT|nr:ATP-dependent RecD-like DNA helicase [Fonticella tunisiensis]TDT62416.1 exodeoxyribonuclease V alpha subunit [Fonticella tunisiensis]